jgi:hypothetical protein
MHFLVLTCWTRVPTGQPTWQVFRCQKRYITAIFCSVQWGPTEQCMRY